MVNTILKEADLFCPNSVRTNFTIYHKTIIVIAIVVMIVSLMGTYVIIDDNWITPSKTVVYQVK
ncbi:hypothetical protein [Levilactobacillus brevis]|uniref:hypothetical protein n=1 Tax=Levilactobacillus brevis TaxID=1580 RepID=UPI00063AB8DF|nr:hypothetical protein [Levilactobacillus brevis]KLE27225.1 hypothetical protein AAX72_13305 [Levilactobacillus brevis]MDM5047279.1 hypothetical protein [Levilactobacillus brevis]